MAQQAGHSFGVRNRHVFSFDLAFSRWMRFIELHPIDQIDGVQLAAQNELR